MQGLTLLIVLGFAFAIAHFLGRKRQMGFGWSLFFCVFFSPLGGLIATLLSRKYDNPDLEISNSKKTWGWVLIVFFSLGVLGQLNWISEGISTAADAMNAISLSIGGIGLGIYLIERSKGKNFSEYSLKKDEE